MPPCCVFMVFCTLGTRQEDLLLSDASPPKVTNTGEVGEVAGMEKESDQIQDW
jgi:hypothetical protein